VFACGASAHAQTIDQSSQHYGGYSSVAAGYWQAQTFTVGVSGYLTSVEVPLISVVNGYQGIPTQADVMLVRAINGRPSSQPSDLLSSGTAEFPDAAFEPLEGDINGHPGFEWVPIELGNVYVTAGDQLAIAIVSNLNHNYEWADDFDLSYPRGGAFWGLPTALGGPVDYDSLFRAYVLAVPEPNTLIGTMLAVAGCLSRRLRRSGNR
jgi:hypothetical protein